MNKEKVRRIRKRLDKALGEETCTYEEAVEAIDQTRKIYFTDVNENADGMRQVNEISLNRVAFEKFLVAVQEITRPVEYGKKARVILDYDPQKPSVHFTYFKEAEPEADVIDLTDEPSEVKISEEDLENIEKKCLWCIGKDADTGTIEIRPMNKDNCIKLYGADWVKRFIEELQAFIEE